MRNYVFFRRLSNPSHLNNLFCNWHDLLIEFSACPGVIMRQLFGASANAVLNKNANSNVPDVLEFYGARN